MLLEGLQLPLTTPFYPDGRLNLGKLEHNVARYSKTPAAGLVALTVTGEGSLLSDEEARHALETVAGAAAAEKVLMANVSRDSVVATLRMAEYAADLGYDAVLVRGSSATRNVKEAVAYFQTLADRAPLPVVLSSTVQPNGGAISLETVSEVAGHPRIIGMVDSSGEVARVDRLRTLTEGVRHEVTVTSVFAAVTGRMQSRGGNSSGGAIVSADKLTDGGTVLAVAPASVQLKTRVKAVGFQMLAGTTAGMLKGLQSGMVGAMVPLAACAPQACYEVLAAWKEGDQGLAHEKQERLLAPALRVEAQLGVPGIKYGCDVNGYFGGAARLPLLPVTGAERTEIEALLQGIRN
jgi:4-hydroxy-2-oxoglutarate aldolase